MNFFEQQHKARKKTGILIFYFVIAVLLIVLAVNAVFFLLIAQISSPQFSLQEWFMEPYWIWVTGGTVFVIFLGSFITSFKLRNGGKAVAEMVGARKVIPNTYELDERRLINVVEEMSIASGTPMPTLYILDDEDGINAFVAGLRPTESVLVVSRGALDNLTRDELQGVIGHEYSHILNNDMRINVRLMGILAGILLIGQLGRLILRSNRSSSSSNNKKGGQLVLIGLGLFLIGYIGIFFGSLIKAAISRQREFLADASSVQFTRNSDGIAGALWKIKQHTGGSLLNNRHSDDIRHFCFGESVSAGFFGFLATHPPLEQRINAIDPAYFNKILSSSTIPKVQAPSVESIIPDTGLITGGFLVSESASSEIHTSSSKIVESIGTVNSQQMEFAKAIYQEIPDGIKNDLQETEGAQQLIFCVLLSKLKASKRDSSIKLIQSEYGDEFAIRLEQNINRTESQLSLLMLINMSIPTLKTLAIDQRNKFINQVKTIIEDDKCYTIFEFSLLTILKAHLSELSEKDVPVKYFKFKPVTNEIKLLLGMLARIANKDEQLAELCFKFVITPYKFKNSELMDKSLCTLSSLTRALEKLNRLSPLLKQSVIQSCVDCILHDGMIFSEEAELLQAISVSLDCPMPPIIQE